MSVRRRLPWRKGLGSFFVPVLRLSEIDEADLERIPITADLRSRVRGGAAELEELLSAGVPAAILGVGI